MLAPKRYLFLPISLVLGASGRASLITYSDQNFAASDWVLTVLTTDRGGSATASQQTKTGTTDTYRQVIVAPNAPIPSQGAEVYAFNIFNTSSSTYSAAHGGAISLISFKEDRLTSTVQEMGPAILQNAILYYAFTTATSTSGSWQTVTQTPALTAFKDATGTLSPDFSATGAPMEFGFVAIDTTAAGGSSTSPVPGDYDNWSITVTTVPEPMTMLSVLSPALLLVRRRRALTTGRSPV